MELEEQLKRERAQREILYLSDFDKEGEFIDFLHDLMRQPETAELGELVYCRFTGQTIEAHRELMARCAETARLLDSVWNEPGDGREIAPGLG